MSISRFSKPSPIHIDEQHVFSSSLERDQYFLNNPFELYDGLFILVDDKLYHRLLGEWRLQNYLLKGQKGDMGVQGEQGTGSVEGGKKDQILQKASDLDHDAVWVTNKPLWDNIINKPDRFEPILGDASDTAFRGDYGLIAYEHSLSDHASVDAWIFDEDVIKAIKVENSHWADVAGSVEWDNIGNKPISFPPQLHTHEGEYEPYNTNIQLHIIAKDNPHNIKKEDIGLGDVQNFAIASEHEAEVGTIHSKYMTPYTTRIAVQNIPHLHKTEDITGDFVTSVIGRTGDIYLVKADVGLENVDNFLTATIPEAIEGIAKDRFMTPETTKEAILHFAGDAATEKPFDGVVYAKPRDAALWHFDTSLNSTTGIKPAGPSNTVVYNTGGKFLGTAFVKEGELKYDLNLGDDYTIVAYRSTATWESFEGMTWAEFAEIYEEKGDEIE